MARDTLPAYLQINYQKYGNKKVALRLKDFGIWKEYTWSDYYENVKYFSLGLVSLGLEPNDGVFIISENNPHYLFAQLGANAARSYSSGFYQDSTPPELKYIIDHCDAKFVVAEDQEQVDKILQVKDELPKIRGIIYWDPKGMRGYRDKLLMRFEEVEELGRDYERTHPGLFEEMINKVDEDDMCMISYTSGSSGLPKGVMLTHGNLIGAARSLQQLTPLTDQDDLFSSAPLCWAAEQNNSVIRNLLEGCVVNFYEEPETVTEDLKEIGPHVMIAPPRIWENMISTIQAKIADSSFIKRLIYNLLQPVGYKIADFRSNKQNPSLGWRLLHGFGYWVMFRPLQDHLGLIRAKRTMTAGAPLSPDSFRFLHALGVNLTQVFGITEAGGNTTIHRDDDIKFETVGQPYPAFQIRLSDQGEILIRGPGLFKGYHKDPEATAKALKDGWLSTGDAGLIDEDGHLVCIDRMSDLMKLKDGTRFAPSYLETRLKFSPYIRDVVILGNEHDFVAAVVIIDYQNMGKWAEDHWLAYSTFTDLSQKPEVYTLVKKEIEKLNRVLPRATRIKKFVNLYKELDPDEAELTRTRKLRRGFIEDRYYSILEAIYRGDSEFTIDGEVKYRDGRAGKVRAVLSVITMEESI